MIKDKLKASIAQTKAKATATTAKAKVFIKELPPKIKQNWKTPNKGEYLTLKEVTSYAFGQIGVMFASCVVGIMTFSASYFCGAVMNIQFMDFYKIGILGTILGYILMFMNPIGVLIYENHGVLSKKTKIFAFASYGGQLILGIACYFLPVNLFETIPVVGMVALPQILGNVLTIGAFGNFVTWFIRRKLCAKYGRIKPFIMLFGIPSAILLSIIPFLPLTTALYSTKLIVLHFAFTFMSFFYNNYAVIGNIVTFITPNTQERQRLYSIVPIVSSLVPSIISMFFPMLIGLTGGYTELLTYKVFVPIFAIGGALIALSAAGCKERVIEKHNAERPKVTFWKGAKQVLQNKYLWITNISNTIGTWSMVIGGILQMWFVYSIRMEWFVGLAANIVVLSMTLGNFACPLLTRKFEKKTILIWSRLVALVTIGLMYLSISVNSVVLFMFAMFLRNGLYPIETGINSGLGADIMEYHQWRFGERADSMSSVFSWFLSPIVMLLGYVMPFLLKGAGFTSDWDVLFNQIVIEKVFFIYIILSVISTTLSVIPFIFYDLTKEKHQRYVEELKARFSDDGDKEVATAEASGALAMATVSDTATAADFSTTSDALPTEQDSTSEEK